MGAVVPVTLTLVEAESNQNLEAWNNVITPWTRQFPLLWGHLTQSLVAWGAGGILARMA